MNRPANPTAIASAPANIEAIDYEVMSYLIQLYGTEQGQRMHLDLREMASQTASAVAKQQKPVLASATAEAILICYGDGVQRSGTMPLQALAEFAQSHLDGVVSGIHILPFFPSSSDDGFAVVDYEKVRTDLGDWPDVQDPASAVICDVWRPRIAALTSASSGPFTMEPTLFTASSTVGAICST